eukprot:scaffold5440_cov88-Isochrysis_galbana.AAC.5
MVGAGCSCRARCSCARRAHQLGPGGRVRVPRANRQAAYVRMSAGAFWRHITYQSPTREE